MRRIGLSLCFCALLAACGSSTSASNNRIVLPPTPVAASAAPPATITSLPLPTAGVSTAASSAAAPTSAYSGVRWHSIPTPGTLTPHQEGANRYAIFVAGTQQATIALYGDAYRTDGWIEESRTTSNGSEFFTYRKAAQRFVVAFGPDLGTNQIVVVIEDGL